MTFKSDYHWIYIYLGIIFKQIADEDFLSSLTFNAVSSDESLFYNWYFFCFAGVLAAKGSQTESSKSGQCPPLERWNTCPSDPVHCGADRDCPNEQLCCASGCGQVCVKPLYSGKPNLILLSLTNRTSGNGD